MRRFVPFLIAGIALIATACGEAIAPPRSDDASALRRVDGPLSAAKNGYVGPNAKYDKVTIPAKGGTVTVGDFTVTFPANAVCDPETSGYGKEYWDAPCSPLGKNYKLKAAYWTENGMPFVEFLADLRFDPNKVVILSTDLSEMDWEDTNKVPEILYWSRNASDKILINKSQSDGDVRTYFDSDSETLYRRIKHFSGYVVTSG